jgi:hypothetical protein
MCLTLWNPAVSLGLWGEIWTRYHSLKADDNQDSMKLGHVRHTNFDKVIFFSFFKSIPQTNQMSYRISFSFLSLLFRLCSVSILSCNLHSFVLAHKITVSGYLYNMKTNFRGLRLETCKTFILLSCEIGKEENALNLLYIFAYKELFMS